MFDLFGDLEVKPVLKWVGGKRELILIYENIIKILNQINT